MVQLLQKEKKNIYIYIYKVVILEDEFSYFKKFFNQN